MPEFPELGKPGIGRLSGRHARQLRTAGSDIPRPGRGYSRFVALAKFVLPAIAAGLVLLVAVWPRLPSLFSSLHLGITRLNLKEARDLRMVNARFNGVDKQNRPYVVTADVARQMPNQDDLISLESPKADMTLQSGAWLIVTAFTGIFQPQGQGLDLFGNVKLIDDRGMEFTTDSAHIDMGTNLAESHEPVEGQGAFGDIAAEGFRVLDHGATIIFSGKSKLHLFPRPAKD